MADLLAVELLGVHEVCEALALSRGALDARRRKPDFPRPVAEVAATPLWAREQIVAYARDRAARLHERPGIERVAAASDADTWLPLADAARMIGVPVGRLRAVAHATPYPNGFHYNLQTGEALSVNRLALGKIARELRRPFVETAA